MCSTSRVAGELDFLVVRLVKRDEVARFNELLDRHHYLGHNLASCVLACTLARLSADAEAGYGDPVLLVETFTDPALHRGTCYKAANFVQVGHSSGYARKNGSWVRHDVVKACWLYPLRRDAVGLL